MNATMCPYSRSHPFIVETSADEAQEWAVATGDWLAAAMTQVSVEPHAVVFNGNSYSYSRDDRGCLHRLDTTIKDAALDFGLHDNQTERFYSRVTKRVARFLSNEKQLAKGPKS